MPIAIRRPANSPVNFSLVNCDPWSLLKMSGRPRRNARLSASMQKSTSIVNDSDPFQALPTSGQTERYILLTEPLKAGKTKLCGLSGWPSAAPIHLS